MNARIGMRRRAPKTADDLPVSRFSVGSAGVYVQSSVEKTYEVVGEVVQLLVSELSRKVIKRMYKQLRPWVHV